MGKTKSFENPIIMWSYCLKIYLKMKLQTLVDEAYLDYDEYNPNYSSMMNKEN